jgi:hypothetical protein
MWRSIGCRPDALALMASHPLTEHGRESPRGLPLAMGVMVLAWAAVGAASAADENRLPVGVRHVMAVVIQEYGFNCPAVKDIQEVGYEWPGYVMKVTCGPFGDAQGWSDRPLRVVGYTEGDYTVTRWTLNSPPRREMGTPSSPGVITQALQ